MPVYQIHINGKIHEVNADAQMPLLWVLRDLLNLKGTKYGCGISQCGACTVHVDGKAVTSCTLPVSSITGRKIVTIEGLGADEPHALQQTWEQLQVPQCGYCQSGQLMRAAALIRNNQPTDDEIRNTMRANLCRCGTYQRIFDAIKKAMEHHK